MEKTDKKYCQGDTSIKNTNEEKNKLTIESEMESQVPPQRGKHHDVYIKMYMPSEMMHTNQSGWPPVILSQWHQYIKTMCKVDSNYINAEHIKGRSSGFVCKAYQAL